MGCNFFNKQRIDAAGVLAVRLEKLLIIFFVLSALGLGINVYEMIHWHVASLAPFFITGICWFVWWLGWRGATQRNTCALMAYFIFTLIGVIFQVIGFFLSSVGGSLITILLINRCAEHAHECPHNLTQAHAKQVLHEYPWIITSIFVFSILVYIIPMFLNVIGLFLSMAIRKEIRAIKKGEMSLSIQEEGAAQNYKMESYIIPKEEQAEVAAPVFYAVPQGNGYLPLNVAGNGGVPTVVYVPYPAQEMQQH